MHVTGDFLREFSLGQNHRVRDCEEDSEIICSITKIPVTGIVPRGLFNTALQ
jgi:hypothetical protein